MSNINLDVLTDRQLEYIATEGSRLVSHLRRARGLKYPATLTLREWLAIIEKYQGLCAYCRVKPFEVMEHVASISAGTTAENCVPACQGCNSLKREKTILRDEQGNLSISGGKPEVQYSFQEALWMVKSRTRSPILTPGEISVLAKMRPDAIRGFIRNGELEAIRIGRHYFVQRDKFDEWMQKRKTPREHGESGMR